VNESYYAQSREKSRCAWRDCHKSCRTCEWVMLHIDTMRSLGAFGMTAIYMKTHHTREWVILHIDTVRSLGALGMTATCMKSHHTYASYVSQVRSLGALATTIKSCHTYVWIMSRIDEVRSLGALCLPCTWSHITHANQSRHTCEWAMPYLWVSHVTHINEPCHTRQGHTSVTDWRLSLLTNITNSFSQTSQTSVSHKRNQCIVGL